MGLNLQIRGQMLAAFGVIVATGLGSGILIQTANQSLSQNVGWTVHTYEVMQSPRGHTAVFAGPGTPEYDFVDRHVRGFLAAQR